MTDVEFQIEIERLLRLGGVSATYALPEAKWK